MINMEESLRATKKASDKILKMLENVDDFEAFAVLNYTFTRMLADRIDDPMTMKAAILTFAVNSASSVDDMFSAEDIEDEHIH